MSSSPSIKFPSKWDSNNVGAKDFFNQCKPYAKETDDFYRMADVSIYFTIFSVIAMAYMVITNLWLFTYYKTYIFKRQCVAYYVVLLIGSLIISIDNVFLENYYETYPCIIHHLLTSIGYPTYFLSVVFIIIKYYKYYYKSQIAYFNSFLGVVEEPHNEILNKKFLFKIFYSKSTSSNALKVLFIIDAISIIYSNLIYFVDNRVSTNGFCGTRTSYLPQMIEFVLFLFVFLPLATIEALKFDDKFKMKKSIIFIIIAHVIYSLGYFLGALVTKVSCSKFVQYTPPAFYVMLSCITSTHFFTVTMLKDILYINGCNKKLKGTYKGMIEMLEDKIQFREFGEFCRKENCVENILFLEEYWRYKKLFNRNDKSMSIIHDISKSFSLSHDLSLAHDKSRSNRDMTKSQEFGDNEETSTRNKRLSDHGSSIAGDTSMLSLALSSMEPKVVDIKTLYSTIEKEAFKFRDNFIGSRALYEINIQNKIVTTIISKLRIVPGDLSKTMEDKIEIYYVIFDDAYKEVINNIYLNSYSNYVHQKNKGQKQKEGTK